MQAPNGRESTRLLRRGRWFPRLSKQATRIQPPRQLQKRLLPFYNCHPSLLKEGNLMEFFSLVVTDSSNVKLKAP
jgi:hypothetical protein